MNATALEARTLHHVPPGDLLLERNIRDVTPSDELVASIKAIGLCEPITAVTNTDGRLVVRFGHRRTVASMKAKLKTVPVYVLGPDQTDTDAEVTRIISQRDENTHRGGLTAADEVGVVEQLSLLGLSADQMVEQARLSRENVTTALAVSGSKMAKSVTEKYESMTLDQALVVAEFEEDPDTVKALVVAAVDQPGQFAHIAQQARDEMLRENHRQQLVHELAKAGVFLFKERPEHHHPKIARLSEGRLRDGDKTITPANHAKCPGHAAYLALGWEWVDADDKTVDDTKVDREQHRQVQRWQVGFVCRDWKKHGHTDSWASGSGSRPKADDMTEAEREKAKAARRLIIDNNKAWDSAATVRREWLAVFATSKTAPKGTGAFLAAAVEFDLQHVLDYQANHFAAVWLDVRNPTGYGKAAAAASEGRALVIALVQVLGRYEAGMGKDDWRHDGTANRTGRYLRFLESAGYPLSDVEKFAISKKSA